MSFPRYPKYKESGVEWLGEVPEHWFIGPLRTIASHNDDIALETTDSEEEILYVDISGVDSLLGIVTKEQMTFAAAPSRARRRVKNGDVIVSTVRTYLRAIAGVVDPEPNLIVSTGFAVIRGRTGVHSTFLKYALSSSYFLDQVISRSTGVSYPAINASELVLVPVAIPKDISEQTAIAAFLDRETGKIDALVQEQERLIELLKEKRQAVISHAVTKGLNPNAPMKDSGIEWLGQVPAHWEIKPLRRFSCFVQSGPFGSQLHADEYVSGQVPVVNPVNLVNGQIIPSEDVTVTSDVVERLAHQKLHAGDVVFSRRGELGRCALVSEREAGWLCGTGSMILRLHKSEYNAGYLSAYLSLEILRQYFISFSVGAIMDSLSSATLLAMPMIVPPMSEQASIVCFVNEQEDRLNQLISTAQRAIDLFQERRTALISAAVTGKIDVRKVAAPSVQEVA